MHAPPTPLSLETPMPHTYLLKKYDVSRTTFWRWRTERGLPCQTVGAKIFVRESDIVRFLAAQDAHQKTSPISPDEHVQI